MLQNASTRRELEAQGPRPACQPFRTKIPTPGVRAPRSLRTCSLLDKPSRREVDVKPDFIGFSIPDEFVVGYGLDLGERFRNLPHIAVYSP